MWNRSRGLALSATFFVLLAGATGAGVIAPDRPGGLCLFDRGVGQRGCVGVDDLGLEFLALLLPFVAAREAVESRHKLVLEKVRDDGIIRPLGGRKESFQGRPASGAAAAKILLDELRKGQYLAARACRKTDV